jgi:hypothetical protein
MRMFSRRRILIMEMKGLEDRSHLIYSEVNSPAPLLLKNCFSTCGEHRAIPKEHAYSYRNASAGRMLAAADDG